MENLENLEAGPLRHNDSMQPSPLPIIVPDMHLHVPLLPRGQARRTRIYICLHSAPARFALP